MPHESSEDSSNQPDGPMGSPKCSPWPPGTPRPPPSTPNDSKTGLLSSLNSSDHLACFSNHQMTHQMSLLILWDILPLPLWSVQSSTAQFRVQSRVYLADLSSPVWSCWQSPREINSHFLVRSLSYQDEFSIRGFGRKYEKRTPFAQPEHQMRGQLAKGCQKSVIRGTIAHANSFQ